MKTQTGRVYTPEEAFAKIQKLEAKAKQKSQELKKEKTKNRELKKSRDSWKEQHKQVSMQLKEAEKRIPIGPSKGIQPAVYQSVSRHKYNLLLMQICIHLYVVGGCSLEGVRKVIEYLNIALGWNLEELPSKGSIDNWLKKAALYSYERPKSHILPEEYAIILDESMAIGKERLMVVLGIEANKKSGSPIDYEDVEVLSMQVKPSWDSKQIAELLGKVVEKMGRKPQYAISDGAGNLKKGLKEAGIERIADVGHEVARLTQQVYEKQEDFKAFTGELAKCRKREVMKPHAFLMPPKQRTVARFMNLRPIINWGRKMLHKLGDLEEDAREAFEFLGDHEKVISELHLMKEHTDKLLKRFKNKGLCLDNLNWAITFCKEKSKEATQNLKRLFDKLTNYWTQEKEKMISEEHKKKTWHCSSDILESLFGCYKSRTPSNPMNGVSAVVLNMALMSQKRKNTVELDIDLRKALEGVFLSQIDHWKERQLLENQVAARKEFLK